MPTGLVNVIFLSSIFYFVLGIYTQEHLIRIRSIYLVLILILTATAISSYILISEIIKFGGYNDIPVGSLSLLSDTMISTGVNTASSTLTIIVLYDIAFSLTWPKILLLLGKYSFGIYLIHDFLLNRMALLLHKKGLTSNNAAFYLVLFACVFVLSFGATWLIWRLPFSDIIFGNRVSR